MMSTATENDILTDEYIESLCPDNFISLLSYNHLSETLSYHPTAFHACNNKEDTLTQSRMLKTSDSAAIIKCQRAEIAGLQKFDVMDIKSINNLPAKAKLISPI
jgi:hypothetical protein